MASVDENEKEVVKLVTIELWNTINSVAKSEPNKKESVEVSSCFMDEKINDFKYKIFVDSSRCADQRTTKPHSQYSQGNFR